MQSRTEQRVGWEHTASYTRFAASGKADHSMNSTIQKLKVAAGFLRQAHALSEGVRDFFGDDPEHAVRLNKIAAALADERAYVAQLVADMKSSSGDSEATKPSRIEQLNSELLECERLNQQLDELTAGLDFASKEGKSSEDVILKSNADYVEKRLLDKMETLANCMALERPKTVRDALIFALRAMEPLQELIMAVSDDHSYERKQGCMSYRLLQSMAQALEVLAGVTRTELGFEEPQTEIDIIEELKTALAQKAAANSSE
jgi:chorismate mutase